MDAGLTIRASNLDGVFSYLRYSGGVKSRAYEEYQVSQPASLHPFSCFFIWRTSTMPER